MATQYEYVLNVAASLDPSNTTTPRPSKCKSQVSKCSDLVQPEKAKSFDSTRHFTVVREEKHKRLQICHTDLDFELFPSKATPEIGYSSLHYAAAKQRLIAPPRFAH